MTIDIRGTSATLELVAGDTEIIRLNAKDSTGATIDMTVGFTGLLGVKNNVLDPEYLIPQIPVVFHSASKGYTVEVTMTPEDTIALLNYNNKNRKKVSLVYDLLVTNTGTGQIATLIAGKMKLYKSIAEVI